MPKLFIKLFTKHDTMILVNIYSDSKHCHPYYQLVTERMTLDDILSTKLSIDDMVPNLLSVKNAVPKLSLTTFEFLIETFGFEPRIPSSMNHIDDMSIGIYEKYLTDETSSTSWVINVANNDDSELKTLLLNRKII